MLFHKQPARALQNRFFDLVSIALQIKAKLGQLVIEQFDDMKMIEDDGCIL